MAEREIPLEELGRDTTHPYDDIDNVNVLEEVLNSSRYEDAWLADMNRRISELKIKSNTKELEKMKIEITDQNYNKLKQLFINEYPNADLNSMELLKLSDPATTYKSDIRTRLLNKNGDLYLRVKYSKGAATVNFGKNKNYKAIKITSTDKTGTKLNKISTLTGNGLSTQDNFYQFYKALVKNTKETNIDQRNVQANAEQIGSTETLRKTIAFAHDDIASTSTPIVPKQRSVIEEIPRQLDSKELHDTLTAEDRNRIVSYLDFIHKNYGKKIQLLNDIEFNKKKIDKAEKQLLTETDDQQKDVLKKFISDSEANIQSSKQMLDQILAYNERQFEDINMRLKSKFTIREKLANIFKKYGLTMTALTLALGLIIDTIVSSVRGTPSPTSSGGNYNITEKIKQSLKNFSTWLLEMSKKALDNLPAIIGSIISFLLKTTASIVGFLAEHIILFVIALAFALYEAIKIGYNDIKQR